MIDLCTDPTLVTYIDYYLYWDNVICTAKVLKNKFLAGPGSAGL